LADRINSSHISSGFCSIGNNYKVALSNLYLNSLDQQMPQQEGERERYANEDLHFLTDALVFLPTHPSARRDGRQL
jgi:hypothetical protein